MTVADGQGVVCQTLPKPGDFGRHRDEWWCKSESGESVLIICCKTAGLAATEAAEYFNNISMGRPLDTVDVSVEGWTGDQTAWTVRRDEVWSPILHEQEEREHERERQLGRRGG